MTVSGLRNNAAAARVIVVWRTCSPPSTLIFESGNTGIHSICENFKCHSRLHLWSLKYCERSAAQSIGGHQNTDEAPYRPGRLPAPVPIPAPEALGTGRPATAPRISAASREAENGAFEVSPLSLPLAVASIPDGTLSYNGSGARCTMSCRRAACSMSDAAPPSSTDDQL